MLQSSVISSSCRYLCKVLLIAVRKVNSRSSAGGSSALPIMIRHPPSWHPGQRTRDSSLLVVATPRLSLPAPTCQHSGCGTQREAVSQLPCVTSRGFFKISALPQLTSYVTFYAVWVLLFLLEPLKYLLTITYLCVGWKCVRITLAFSVEATKIWLKTQIRMVS